MNEKQRKRTALIFGVAIGAGIVGGVAAGCVLKNQTQIPMIENIETKKIEAQESTTEQIPQAEEVHQLIHIVFEITSVFEGTNTMGYGTTSRTDALSGGLMQMNVAPAATTMNDFMNYMLRHHDPICKEAFGIQYDTLRNLFKNKSSKEIYQFFNSRGNYERYSSSISNILTTIEGVNYQLRDINWRMDRAHAICDEYGFRSVRALAYAFDKVVNFGSYGARNYFFSAINDIDTSKIDSNALIDDYFMPIFERECPRGANRQSYIQFKRDFITDLHDNNPDAYMEYYLLSRMNDHFTVMHKKQNWIDTRGHALLGLSARRIDGEWVNGDVVHGNFFAVNNGILNKEKEYTRFMEFEKPAEQQSHNNAIAKSKDSGIEI